MVHSFISSFFFSPTKGKLKSHCNKKSPINLLIIIIIVNQRGYNLNCFSLFSETVQKLKHWNGEGSDEERKKPVRHWLFFPCWSGNALKKPSSVSSQESFFFLFSLSLPSELDLWSRHKREKGISCPNNKSLTRKISANSGKTNSNKIYNFLSSVSEEKRREEKYINLLSSNNLLSSIYCNSTREKTTGIFLLGDKQARNNLSQNKSLSHL